MSEHPTTTERLPDMEALTNLAARLVPPGSDLSPDAMSRAADAALILWEECAKSLKSAIGKGKGLYEKMISKADGLHREAQEEINKSWEPVKKAVVDDHLKQRGIRRSSKEIPPSLRDRIFREAPLAKIEEFAALHFEAEQKKGDELRALRIANLKQNQGEARVKGHLEKISKKRAQKKK